MALILRCPSGGSRAAKRGAQRGLSLFHALVQFTCSLL